MSTTYPKYPKQVEPKLLASIRTATEIAAGLDPDDPQFQPLQKALDHSDLVGARKMINQIPSGRAYAVYSQLCHMFEELFPIRKDG